MRKWIPLAAITALLLGLFLYSQRNAVKVSYVNGLPEYEHLPGREHIFQRDCYLFNFKHTPADWPLVGANVPGSVMSVPELPAEVSSRYIGADLPAVRIIDLVRIGDRARIISVRREESRHGTKISFLMLFNNEAERHYPRIDAWWIMDHTPESRGAAPFILPEYAAEIVPGRQS